MATEDERYRQSSQFRLWSFTPSKLHEMRCTTNSLAKQQIAPRMPSNNGQIDFLSPDEEVRLVRYLTIELLRAAQFCELPTETRSTAAIFFRRFYITNSIMTYPPGELLKTSLFFGCKADGYFIKLDKLVEKMSGTTNEQILAGEFLLCQGVRFAFDVRHPFRALEGAVFELRRRRSEEESRINKAHVRAREILKFSALVTDVYFHYTPSQIMMAALQMADSTLFNELLPEEPRLPNNETPQAHAEMHKKILETIANCRAMLEEEPPERMSNYWETPEATKAIKPLRKKLQKCRDPDRFDLVALQRARREKAGGDKKPTSKDDSDVFGGDSDLRDPKRRKVGADDAFGPPL